MPYLKIQTNLELDSEKALDLLRKASAATAEALGKPERYVMTSFAGSIPMTFAGEPAPLAYLELKSIGLPRSRTAQLSAMLCALISEELAIPAERIYIEFADAARDMWGWDGGTFA